MEIDRKNFSKLSTEGIAVRAAGVVNPLIKGLSNYEYEDQFVSFGVGDIGEGGKYIVWYKYIKNNYYSTKKPEEKVIYFWYDPEKEVITSWDTSDESRKVEDSIFTREGWVTVIKRTIQIAESIREKSYDLVIVDCSNYITEVIEIGEFFNENREDFFDMEVCDCYSVLGIKAYSTINPKYM